MLPLEKMFKHYQTVLFLLTINEGGKLQHEDVWGNTLFIKETKIVSGLSNLSPQQVETDSVSDK